MPTLRRKALAVAGAAAAITAALASPAIAAGGVVAQADTATVVEGGTVIVDVLGNDTIDPDGGTVSVAPFRLADAAGSSGWTAGVLEGNAIEIRSTGTAKTTPTLRIGYTVSNTIGDYDTSYITVDVTPDPSADPGADPLGPAPFPAPAPVADPNPTTDPAGNGDGATEGNCPGDQVPTPGSIGGCGDATGSGYTVLCQHDWTLTRTVPGTGPQRLGGGTYEGGTHSTAETYTHKPGARLDAPGSGCFDRFQHVGAMGQQTSAMSVLTTMLTGSESGGKKVGPVGNHRVTITPRMVTCQARGERLVSCGAPQVIARSVAEERITAKPAPSPKGTPHVRNVPDPKHTPHERTVPHPKVPVTTIDAGAAYQPPASDTGAPTLAGLVFLAAGVVVVRRRRVSAR